MTWTEARLADALHAAADCLVQAETLRPLTLPEEPRYEVRRRLRLLAGVHRCLRPRGTGTRADPADPAA